VKRTLLLALGCALPAFASGLMDHGEDIFPRETTEVKLTGYFRVRSDLLHNLDLDRGTDPTGQPLFPVPLADPNGQDLFSTDARLRTDLAVYAPFATIAVKVRTDLLDDLVLGSTPVLSPGSGTSPTPAASPGQQPSAVLHVRRAYAEALTPVGLLSAGRMGNHWGLGLLSHGGDCLDCDHGDAADRVAFVTALAQHLWAVAYDFTAVGPLASRPDGTRSVVLDPSVDVHTLTFAVMNVRDDVSLRRRLKAEKTTVQYGFVGSYRWQDFDAPATYLPTVAGALTPASVMVRGYKAGMADGWFRFQSPWLRVEAEAALLFAQVDQPSLIPGLLLRDSVYSTQVGAALETQLGGDGARLVGGLNAGYASGDPAPGFGAFPRAGATSTPGVLDGPQVDIPRDVRVDNFRFSPDYRIDRILFAEIIGTVTDAVYLRPWVRARLVDFASSALVAKGSATLARAIYASSTPGNDAALGAETDLGLEWQSKDGFNALLEYAVLFPMAGFDNPAQHLTAQPAQLARLRLAWVF
jgi:uncharacterized protein (TIGR04551 family)